MKNSSRRNLNWVKERKINKQIIKWTSLTSEMTAHGLRYIKLTYLKKKERMKNMWWDIVKIIFIKNKIPEMWGAQEYLYRIKTKNTGRHIIIKVMKIRD